MGTPQRCITDVSVRGAPGCVGLSGLCRSVRPSPQLDRYVRHRTGTDRHTPDTSDFQIWEQEAGSSNLPTPTTSTRSRQCGCGHASAYAAALSRWRRWLTRSLRLGLGSGSSSPVAAPDLEIDALGRADERCATSAPGIPPRGPSDQHGEHRDRWRGTWKRLNVAARGPEGQDPRQQPVTPQLRRSNSGQPAARIGEAGVLDQPRVAACPYERSRPP